MELSGRISADERHKVKLAFVLAAAFALLCVLINPVGYVGGGADDEHYLAAARCWVEQGAPCLPPNHWWTRWPAFAPVALSSALLGESRFTLSIGPFVYWASALAALASLATLWFNWRVAVVAVVFLAAMPAFAFTALDPTCDGPELAFQLGALVAAALAYRRQSALLAIIGGIAAGLALQARDTSLLFAAVSAFAWLFLDSRRRRVLLWAIGGFAGVIVADLMIYGFATGDPFLRYRLALGHVGVPSHALPEGFDTSRSPLFNPDYIKAWKREEGISLFWPLDPWLNLVAAPGFRTLFGLLLVGLLLYRDRLVPVERSAVKFLLLSAALWAVLLVYGLAVDPRPRMFLPLAAAGALAGASLVVSAWRSGSRPMAAVLVLLHLVLGVRTIDQHASSEESEARARQWLDAYPTRIEITKGARSYLTLIPAVRDLPEDRSGREMVILNSVIPCDEVAGSRPGGSGHGRVVDSLKELNAGQSYLCLIAYTDAYYRDRGLLRR